MTIGNVVPLILIAAYFEGHQLFWGIFGYLFILLVWSIVRLTSSGFLMKALRGIEGAIWGKPLDKDMWAKGELKNKKVKIVWKK